MLTLRSIQPSDKTHCASWWRDAELISMTSGDLRPLSDQQVTAYFEKMLHSTDIHRMIVASGQTIGHISLSRRPGDWHELQMVIGDKTAWGKGYGQQAIEQLFILAKNQGIARVYLEVRPYNSRAIRLYQKAAFTLVGHTPDGLLRMERGLI